MKLPFSATLTDSRITKMCRIQRWAHAWAESFRHEAKAQTSPGPLTVEEIGNELDFELANSGLSE